MKIRVYKNDEIDKKLWDERLSATSNALIYARSIYLDHMCPGWYALTDDAHNYLMPLPVNSRMGIRYSYQPPFIQQLGIFSRMRPEKAVISAFLNKVREISRSINLYFNYGNEIPGGIPRRNYILDLRHGFEKISAGFKKEVASHGGRHGLYYGPANFADAFSYYQKYVMARAPGVNLRQLKQYEKLVSELENQDMAIARQVISPGGDILSIAIFLRDARRLYYNLAANSPDGRMQKANARLLYEVIREFSGQELIFDFEGSEIAGVRFFFEKFGPVNQPYYQYEYHHLTPLQQMAKKIGKTLGF